MLKSPRTQDFSNNQKKSSMLKSPRTQDSKTTNCSGWPDFVPQFCFPLISLVKSSLALCIFALCNQLWIEKTWKKWEIGQLRASFTPQPDHLGIKTGSVLKIAWHQLQLSTIWPKSSEASFGSYKALNIPQNGFQDRKHHDLQNTGLCVTKASVENQYGIHKLDFNTFSKIYLSSKYDKVDFSASSSL